MNIDDNTPITMNTQVQLNLSIMKQQMTNLQQQITTLTERVSRVETDISELTRNDQPNFFDWKRVFMLIKIFLLWLIWSNLINFNTNNNEDKI
jgi:hypothetical protein